LLNFQFFINIKYNKESHLFIRGLNILLGVLIVVDILFEAQTMYYRF